MPSYCMHGRAHEPWSAGPLTVDAKRREGIDDARRSDWFCAVIMRLTWSFDRTSTPVCTSVSTIVTLR